MSIQFERPGGPPACASFKGMFPAEAVVGVALICDETLQSAAARSAGGRALDAAK
jgi:hypothetical protein